MSDGGWIGVDLDGTLAQYIGWRGPLHIGDPVPAMLERVKKWLAEGKRVKIVTARVAWEIEESGHLIPLADKIATRRAIQDWCVKHVGELLPITCFKDFGMIELWDDRAVQLEPNTGRRMDGKDG